MPKQSVPPRQSRPYDIVLLGATGFTGGLTAEYLAAHGPAELRWALAGRNRDKLEAVRERLGQLKRACAKLPLIEVDSSDAEGLRQLAESTRVVISTVGPYLQHGGPLVAACAAAGTDYVDLTGEPEFVDRMWLDYHAKAKKSGARIVHCCGFDSIPHDLGVWYTVRQLPEGVPLTVEGFVRAGGGFSGGTLHSAVTQMGRLRLARALARERRECDPLPKGRRIGSTHERVHRVSFDGKPMWALPMPTIDPQIVRRSAAADPRYGPQFRYGHYVQVKSLRKAAALIGGVGALLLGAQWGPTREWLMKFKAAGAGPSAAQRAKAWFKVRFVGAGGGCRVETEVAGGDPGYGETSRMLAESALCLAFDELPPRAGVLTPAQAMGEALFKRLQAIGIKFSVVSKEASS